MVSNLCLILAVIGLAPLILYVLGFIQDPFHPTILIGPLTFVVAGYKLLKYPDPVYEFVTPEIVAFYLWNVIFSLLCFYTGWITRWNRVRRLEITSVSSYIPVASYDSKKMLGFAALFVIVGVTVRFTASYTTTGYILDLNRLWIPGLILAIQVLTFDRVRQIIALFIAGIGLVPPIALFFSYGSRGDTFRLVVLVFPYYLIRRKRPNKLFAIGTAALLAVILSVLADTRAMVGEGSSMSRLEALAKLGTTFFTRPQEKYAGGEEFIFGPAMMEAAQRSGSFDNGMFIYNIGVRFLPKEIFPDKSQYYTPWSAADYKRTVSLWMEYSVPGGSAPSGFAHAFVEFGYFCFVFWFLVGFLFQRIYKMAIESSDLRNQGLFVVAYIAGLYLVTQDLYDSTLNWIFCMIPLSIAYWFSIKPQSPHTVKTEFE